MRFTSTNVATLAPFERFVFGSNLSGVHGAGAARKALEFGAKIGVGEGPSGSTYAIATKDRQLDPLPLSYISDSIKMFLDYAKNHKDETFLVTKLGCGLAGYTIFQIAPLFWPSGWKHNPPSNVILAKEFWDVKIAMDVSPQSEFKL